jgi:hypothetical protein
MIFLLVKKQACEQKVGAKVEREKAQQFPRRQIIARKMKSYFPRNHVVEMTWRASVSARCFIVFSLSGVSFPDALSIRLS